MRASNLPALVVLLPLLAASPASAYTVLTLDGRTLDASTISFIGDNARLGTAQGQVVVLADDIDYYQTFLRNMSAGTSNVVVFNTGSLLRYERIDLVNGQVRLGMGKGAEFTVMEGLLDFRASVVEGANVNLPKGSTHVAISRAAPGGAFDGGGGEEGEYVSEDPTLAGRARPGRPVSSRRVAGRTGGAAEPAEADRVMAEEAAAEAAAAAMEANGDTEAADEGGGQGMTGGEGRAPQGAANRGGSPNDPGKSEVRDAVTVNVGVSTDFSDEVGGLSVDLSYPAGCTVLAPTSGPAFTGFAAGFTTAVNTGRGGNAASPLRVGGFAPPDTKVRGPGEFMRAVFRCTTAQESNGFEVVDAKAYDEKGADLPTFSKDRANVSVN